MKNAARTLSGFTRYFLFGAFIVICLLTVINLALPKPQAQQMQAIQSAQTAQSAPTTSSAGYSVNTNLAKDQHTRVQTLIIDLSSAFICQLAGIDVVNPQQGCVTIDPVTNKLGYAPVDPAHPQIGGVLGLSTHMISSLYNQPISSGEYLATLSNNFGFTEKAYAQNGTGFRVLSPLQSLWTTIRNVTYIIFILVFVIIGVGIMLRVKIDPRTSMTLQNQIPKIVIGLILITFSYAIAGLFVDFMWVVTYTGVNLVTRDVNKDFADQTNIYCPHPEAKAAVGAVATGGLFNNPIAYVTDLFGDETGCLGSVDGIIGVSAAVGNTLGDVLSRAILESLGMDADLGPCRGGGVLGIGVDISNCLKEAVFGFFKYLIGIIATLILIVAVIIALFRLWFVLIRSFVYVILGTIVGPLYIAAGLLPGSSLGFANWLRFLAAHTLVFPATVILIVIARVIYVTPNIGSPEPGATFIPPLIGNPNLADNFGNLITIGMLFILPEILNLLRDAFKTQPNKYLSPAIQKGFSRGVGPVSAPISSYWGRLTRFDPHKNEVGLLAGVWRQKTGNTGPVGRFFRGTRGMTDEERRKVTGGH